MLIVLNKSKIYRTMVKEDKLNKFMDILIWVIFGGIAGWIASMLAGTDAQQGILLNIIVGIIGAVIGGWLMTVLGGVPVTGFNLYSMVVAIIGAVVFLAILKMIRRV